MTYRAPGRRKPYTAPRCSRLGWWRAELSWRRLEPSAMYHAMVSLIDEAVVVVEAQRAIRPSPPRRLWIWLAA